MPIQREGVISEKFAPRIISIGSVAISGYDPHDIMNISRDFGKASTKPEDLPGPLELLAESLFGKSKKSPVSQEDEGFYIEGIKQLAARNVPGFAYREGEIDGKPFTIAIDASAQIDKEENAPFASLNANNKSHPMMTELKETMTQKASSDVLGFKHDIEAKQSEYKQKDKLYTEAMRKYFDGGMKDTPPDMSSLPTHQADAETVLWFQMGDIKDEIMADVIRTTGPQLKTPSTPAPNNR